MKQQSGLESLLEALKQSGMNVDGANSPFGGQQQGQQADAGAGNGGAGGGSPFGGSPFGGSPFGGSPFGGQRAAQQADDGNGGGNKPPTPHVEIPFMDSFKSMSKKALVGAVLLLIVVILVAYWWFHPPISIHSVDTWTFVTIFVLLPLFLLFRSKSRTYETGNSKVDPNQGKAKTFKVLSFLPVAVLAVAVVGGVLSLSVIPGNAAKYANVLQTENGTFAEDIQEVNYSEIPVIDHENAILLGNREMGSIPEYVSQFEVSDLYSQINYQGEPVRVSPLLYADLFKWFTNREAGIPAYALVNMTTQDAEIVRLGDNPIHYSESEPLFRNIARHVQLSYPFYIFDELSFEIDEEGKAWWICPVRDYTIGLFGGQTISRVVLCDATTGECQDLAVEDCPQWVDRVYPADLLITQYNWYGKYNNGWLNSFLGQEGVVQTTPGTNGLQGYNYIAKDDDVWVYSGVTSATADNSIVGFILMNQRTQESHYYAVAGATEESAMSSAEGQVQNLRYTATFPLLINVADQPTYFMALKDAAGLVKKFAMVDIQRYQNVAVGDTVADCQRAYEALLATSGIDTSGGVVVATTEVEGTISRMAQAVIGGNSHFYVTIEGDEAVYDFALPGLIGIVSYQVGDTIKFAYVEDGTPVVVDAILSEAPVGETITQAPVVESQEGQGAATAAESGEGSANEVSAVADPAAEQATDEAAAEE